MTPGDKSADNYYAAGKAFSKQSSVFEKEEEGNIILETMRRQVRDEVLNLLEKGDRVLELNAGTGLDATFFASKGYEVVATDIAEGMVFQLKNKVKALGLGSKINVVRSGFHEVEKKVPGKFDLFFSNFGGLNCEHDLENVFTQLDKLSNPGAKALLVIMPPVCLQEIITVIKGNFRHSFRRFNKDGVTAYVEGEPFRTWYYSRSQVKEMLPLEWKIEKTIGLGSLLPQPHSPWFPEKHPFLFRLLKFADAGVRNLWPFNRWGDHLIFVLKRRS